MTVIHHPHNRSPDHLVSSQVVKSWIALDNKQNDNQQQQHGAAVIDQISGLSLSTSPYQQHLDQIKFNHQQLQRSSSLLMGSTSLLSVLLRDTRQPISPRSRLSHSSSSFTYTNSTEPSPTTSIDTVDEDNNNNLDDDDDVKEPKNNQQQSLFIKQLQLKVEKQEQEIAVLKACLAFANQKLQDVTDKAEKAVRIQQQTENELEDLSTQLFEQANEMVAKERRVAKEQMDATKKELGSVRCQLDQERTLRQQIGQHYNNNNGDQQKYHPIVQQQLLMDGHGLASFRDFVQRVRSVSGLEQINRLFFIKQCIEQDIHPCLQRMKKLSTRKLLNSLVRRPCHIEKTTALSTAPCFACGMFIPQHHTQFQFRLNDHDKSWHTIDQPCKDRLLAISNFYEFVRHLHLGLQGQQRSIENLFHEMVWLRLYLFWARSGILPMYHDHDISAEQSALLTTSKLFDARSQLLS